VATPLDDTDRRILDELAVDGRMSMRTLADRLHVSRANAYARVDRLQKSGVIRGFRADVDPVDIHMVISAYCVFRIANRHTFKAIFKRDMLSPDRRDVHRALLGDLLVDYLTAT